MIQEPKVAILSLWMNDEHRHIAERIDRLLRRSYRNRRYIWLVGDSTDGTFEILRSAAEAAYTELGVCVTVGRRETGIQVVGEVAGTTNPDRLKRLSVTVTEAFRMIEPEDDYVIIHESDLVTPHDIVELFLANADAGRCPVAGWPILEHPSAGMLFYDTWGYSHESGDQFWNTEPRPGAPFVVSSFGSVAMIRAHDLSFMTVRSNAFREICWNLRQKGRRLWCDPSITVIQPTELWP